MPKVHSRPNRGSGRRAIGPDRSLRLLATCLLALTAFGLKPPGVAGRGWAGETKSKVSPAGTIVFTGSSSIAYWDSLAEDMRPLRVMNSAFGGAQYSELLEQEQDLVIAYRPSAVVVYAGDNDLAAGSRKTPQSVANDARQFVRIVHSQLPETWVYVLAIKPSYARWNSWHKMKEANQLIEAFVRSEDHAQFVDVASPMFEANGNLPRDLFVADGLHPTAKCYAMWTAILKPILLGRFGSTKSSARNQGAPKPNPQAMLLLDGSRERLFAAGWRP